MPKRFDDPALDLVAHARAVVRGDVPRLAGDARLQMIMAVGIQPSPTASDRTVARNYLAARGARP